MNQKLQNFALHVDDPGRMSDVLSYSISVLYHMIDHSLWYAQRSFVYTYSRVMFAGNIFFKIVKSCTLHRYVSPQLHCLGQSNAKQDDIHAANTSKATRPTFILRVFSLAELRSVCKQNQERAIKCTTLRQLREIMTDNEGIRVTLISHTQLITSW